MQTLIPYISISISIFGFLITIGTLGYYFGRFQANTQNMKEKIVENKVDYKDGLKEHELKQDKTISRLYEQIEKMNCVQKPDCDKQTRAYEARLEYQSKTFCGLTEKINEKLNALEIKITTLFAEKK